MSLPRVRSIAGLVVISPEPKERCALPLLFWGTQLPDFRIRIGKAIHQPLLLLIGGDHAFLDHVLDNAFPGKASLPFFYSWTDIGDKVASSALVADQALAFLCGHRIGAMQQQHSCQEYAAAT